jgi:hypothetical protein
MSPENHRNFAEILGVPEWLIRDLHTILSVISCGLPIDPEKFGVFCHNLFQKYVNEFPWNYLSASMHKLLTHAKAIIQASALPLGMLSEQAAESKNKDYRSDRETHARKTSRINNLKDVFNRSMYSSDPFISDFGLAQRLRKRKRMPLSHDAISLLKEPEVEIVPSSLVEDEDEDEENQSRANFDKVLDDVVLVLEDHGIEDVEDTE